MENFDYIIPIGDNCMISQVLNALKIRKCSFPFDWTARYNPLENTTIFVNSHLTSILYDIPIKDIVKLYLGDALEHPEKLNIKNNIKFPHDTEKKEIVFEKYERRFNRLKDIIKKKNLFIFMTRIKFIEEKELIHIINRLLFHNPNSKIIFISGTNHPYIEKYKQYVIFKHIFYDKKQFYKYDYSHYMPSLKVYLSKLFNIKKENISKP